MRVGTAPVMAGRGGVRTVRRMVTSRAGMWPPLRSRATWCRVYAPAPPGGRGGVSRSTVTGCRAYKRARMLPWLAAVMATASTATPHPDEPHAPGIAGRLNWLRAGVLGANDGIVSVAALVVGVAAATTQLGAIITAGLAALIGGAISMALGEYVSVSSQSDKALIAKEKDELARMPAEELDELTAIYEAKGLSPETARTVAEELTERDALRAHLREELNIDPDDLG